LLLNEEGRKAGPSASLNAAQLPSKGEDGGRLSNAVCHYCKKKGHIQPKCHTEKKDERTPRKRRMIKLVLVVRLQMLMFCETTASIEEVDEMTSL